MRGGTFVALGVEGEGGRQALKAFLEDLLGCRVRVTAEQRSVDKNSMATCEYEWGQAAERAVSALVQYSSAVKIDSVFVDNADF